MSQIEYVPLSQLYFDAVIALGNQVHGDNYLDGTSIREIYHKGICNGINASWLALEQNQLIGFRLTYAPKSWQPDKWCSPQQWQLPTEQVCYFKCNTVAESCRGKGVGSALLQHSINAALQQGARAGVTHIWMQSPGNSAYRYFHKNGGELVKIHPDRWHGDFEQTGYICVRCGQDCHCDAGEMILRFASKHG